MTPPPYVRWPLNPSKYYSKVFNTIIYVDLEGIKMAQKNIKLVKILQIGQFWDQNVVVGQNLGVAVNIFGLPTWP